MTADGPLNLRNLLVRYKPLDVVNDKTGANRAVYDRALRETTFLLSFSQIDGAQPGTVRYAKQPDPDQRYFPSIAALQLYLEEDEIADGRYVAPPPEPDDETPADRSARIAAAVETLAAATYANDSQLTPDFPWNEPIEFQTKYTYVYEAFRHRVLVARQAREKVVLTRAVEKNTLATLLADQTISQEIAKLQQVCVDAFATAQLNRVQPAVLAVVTFVNQTLYDKFFALANLTKQ